jgi:hypothetical protein
VHAEPGDGVCRQLPLVKVSGRERRWALALEVWRLSRGVKDVVESPADLDVGGVRVPARWTESRAMRIRYASRPIEQISFWQLRNNPALAERFRGRVVFVGVTAQSAAADRFMTPISDAQTLAGVEIHANAFETLAGGRFLVSASNLGVAGLCLALAAAGVVVFAFRGGWQAYAAAAMVLGAAHLFPYWMLKRGVVFPYFAPVSAAWLSVVGAGAFQFVTVRRQLRKLIRAPGSDCRCPSGTLSTPTKVPDLSGVSRLGRRQEVPPLQRRFSRAYLAIFRSPFCWSFI